MFNKFSLALAATLSIAFMSYGQEPCATDAKYQEILKQHPEIRIYEQQFEDQIKSNLQSRLNASTARTTVLTADTTTYDVTVVVHVVHDYGTEYLADNDIYEAVKYWASIYVEHNADTADVIAPFVPYVGNPRIRLHLATIDPDGKPTKGVVHHRTYLTANANDQAKIGQWPQDEYINVWFIRAFGAEVTGAAAYAYYPSSAAAQPFYDGVIGLSTYLNLDKAIPHEIGHVFNLQHPWGNTNAPDIACGDDEVDDTPPTKGHTPTGCSDASLYDTTCATGYSRAYTLPSGADSVVNYPDTVNSQNIMDYTYCQRMFTKGQVIRMRTALTNSTAGRNNLYTAATLAATGALAAMPDLPPVADFSIERGIGATMTDTRSYFLTFNNIASFAFRNKSWNDTVASVAWSFSNGASTPASTSLVGVNNKFSVPGWVSVSLIANSNAGSDTITNSKAVYAADTTAIPAHGYVQQFSSEAAITNWPMFNYYDNQYKWSLYTGAGIGDNTCIRYRSFDTTEKHIATPLGDHDDFYTPAFSFAGITGDYYMNFNTAAAKTFGLGGFGPASVGDSLEIDASTNGGDKWTKIVGFRRGELVNNPTSSTEFVPAGAAAWAFRAVSIPETVRSSNTFFRFRYWPGNIGNDFYMDNLYLYPYPMSVAETKSIDNVLKVFPNPSATGCTLVLKTGNDGLLDYSVKDITGRVLVSNKQQYQPNTLVSESISRSVTPAAGIYFVVAVIDGLQVTEKIVVY